MVIGFLKEKNKGATYVFIDASNLWQAQKVMGRMLDYDKLKNYLKEKYGVNNIQVFYYTAYPANGTRDFSLNARHNFFTYLKKGLSFIVRKKPLKRIVVRSDVGDSIQEKGNMDVEITIDAMHFKEKYNTAIFFTGDSDFLPLITYLRNGKKKVYIYSSKNNISSELRTGSDGYVDILELDGDIWGRELKYRNNA